LAARLESNWPPGRARRGPLLRDRRGWPGVANQPVRLAPGGPGIRVDSHVYDGYTVPPHYDSMIGKLIAYGDTREQAIRRMRIALSEMSVEGIKTNIPFHRKIMESKRFIESDYDTHFFGRVPPKIRVKS
jgi:biotin carboxylase